MGEIVRLDPGPRMSRAVVYGGLLYSSGHVAAQPGDLASQTRDVLAKLDDVLAQAGSSRSRILNANVWLADIGDFDVMNEVWESWIDRSAPPARATVESRLAGPEYRIEIAIVAAVP